MAKSGKRRETLGRNSITSVDRQKGGVLHVRREERTFRGNSLEGSGTDSQGDIKLSLVAMQTKYASEFYLNRSRTQSYKVNDLTFPASGWPLLLIKNGKVRRPLRLCGA